MDAVSSLPELPDLPDTFFGWVPVLYKITEQQVLAAAGLDAYVVCDQINTILNLPC
jgi:Late exocytosis, associated with Golgi transport